MHLNGALHLMLPAAGTLAARLFRHDSRTVALRTLVHDRKKALRHCDLPASAATLTAFLYRPRLTAGTVAGLTGRHALKLNRLIRTENRFFKSDFKIVTQIRSVQRTVRVRPARLSASEERIKNSTSAAHAAECLTEKIERIHSASAAHAAMRKRRFAILIIHLALFRISKNLISLGNLLEMLLRLLIPRILVRVIFDGEAPVRFFDLGIGRLVRDLKDLVIISHYSALASFSMPSVISDAVRLVNRSGSGIGLPSARSA